MHFLAWMSIPTLVAVAILYAGYLAYDAQRERARRAVIPVGPDPRLELERINADIEELAADSRRRLDSAREAMRLGLR